MLHLLLAVARESKLPKDWPWVVLAAVAFATAITLLLMWMARREARRHAADDNRTE